MHTLLTLKNLSFWTTRFSFLYLKSWLKLSSHHSFPCHLMCLYSNTKLFSDGGTAQVIYFTFNITEICIFIVWVHKKFGLAWMYKVGKLIIKVCLWYLLAFKQIWSLQVCFGNNCVEILFETQTWRDAQEHICL